MQESSFGTVVEPLPGHANVAGLSLACDASSVFNQPEHCSTLRLFYDPKNVEQCSGRLNTPLALLAILKPSTLVWSGRCYTTLPQMLSYTKHKQINRFPQKNLRCQKFNQKVQNTSFKTLLKLENTYNNSYFETATLKVNMYKNSSKTQTLHFLKLFPTKFTHAF